MLNWLSNDPKLSWQRLLVYGALGYYVYSLIKMKRAGQLAGEPEMLVKIDKKKMFEMAEKKFKLNPMHRSMLEGIYDKLMNEGEDA